MICAHSSCRLKPQRRLDSNAIGLAGNAHELVGRRQSCNARDGSVWQAGIIGSKVRHIDLEAAQTFDRVKEESVDRERQRQRRVKKAESGENEREEERNK